MRWTTKLIDGFINWQDKLVCRAVTDDVDRMALALLVMFIETLILIPVALIAMFAVITAVQHILGV